jgi:hypothetical protein
MWGQTSPQPQTRRHRKMVAICYCSADPFKGIVVVVVVQSNLLVLIKVSICVLFTATIMLNVDYV